MQPLRAAIFDLDDTLYDCHGSLVRRGHELAAAAMAEAGVPAPVEAILALRLELAAAAPAAVDAGVRAALGGPEAAVEAGRRAYHRPDRIASIRPFPCARAVIERCAEAGVEPVLMTRGVEEIQRAKLDALGLGDLFATQLFVPVTQRKRAMLEGWLADSGLAPAQVAVIGDRVDGEIAAGHALGMRTVWLQRGEFAQVVPGTDAPRPDHHLRSLAEVPEALGLAGVRVEAPCRVDLGGGTLDIWPIAQLIGGGRTVNAALSLRQSVEIRPCVEGPVLRVVSKERGARLSLATWDEEPDGELALFARAVRELPPPFPCVVETFGAVPKGSGLGGSSALLVALLRGLCFLRGEAMPRRKLVELAANLEARAIGVPTGIQDYLAALGGGFRSVRFDAFGWVDEACHPPAAVRTALARGLVLFYAGEPHFSAVPNWLMMRAAIDEAARCLPLFRTVAEAADQAWQALRDGDLAALAAAFDLDWQGRKALAEGVSTPKLERLIAAAREAGAAGVKVCGSGGGGTFLALCPPAARQAVIDAVSAAGGEHLPVTFGVAGADLTRIP